MSDLRCAICGNTDGHVLHDNAERRTVLGEDYYRRAEIVYHAFRPTSDYQTIDLLAALAERGIYSRGDLESYLERQPVAQP